jgi:hypothetical protein
VDLLGTAGDNENGDVTGIQDTGVRDINTTNIQDAAVRLETSGGVLLSERSVDGELSIRKPELQSLNIALDVGVKNLREDVFTQLALEFLHLEVGINLTESLDNLSSLVLGKEASNLIGDAAGCADEGVLGFVVNVAEAEQLLHHRIGILEVAP